jgi:hypothetical protein
MTKLLYFVPTVFQRSNLTSRGIGTSIVQFADYAAIEVVRYSDSNTISMHSMRSEADVSEMGEKVVRHDRS